MCTPCHPPPGSLPFHQSFAGRPFSAAARAADHQFTDPPPIALSGIAE